MQNDPIERAGVIVLRDDRLALIERHHRGRRYWISGRGSYEAVWVPIAELEPDRVLLSAVVRWILDTGGEWPDEPVIIDERKMDGPRGITRS